MDNTKKNKGGRPKGYKVKAETVVTSYLAQALEAEQKLAALRERRELAMKKFDEEEAEITNTIPEGVRELIGYASKQATGKPKTRPVEVIAPPAAPTPPVPEAKAQTSKNSVRGNGAGNHAQA